MEVNFSYAKAEEIPESIRDLEMFTEKAGKWQLNIVGAAPAEQVSRLESSLEKERKDRKLAVDSLRAFGDLDAAEVLEKLGKIDELQAQVDAGEGGKLDDDAIDKLVEKRVERIRGPLDRDLQKATDLLTTLTEENGTLKKTAIKKEIREVVAIAADKAKTVTSAKEDILFLAESIFEIADDGVIVTKENKIGVSVGLTPDLWLEKAQEDRPHWWPPSEGGGAKGGGKGGIGGNNPWSKTAWNKTEQGKIYTENPDRAKQLAEQVGSTVLATHPPK